MRIRPQPRLLKNARSSPAKRCGTCVPQVLKKGIPLGGSVAGGVVPHAVSPLCLRLHVCAHYKRCAPEVQESIHKFYILFTWQQKQKTPRNRMIPGRLLVGAGGFEPEHAAPAEQKRGVLPQNNRPGGCSIFCFLVCSSPVQNEMCGQKCGQKSRLSAAAFHLPAECV